MPQIIKKRESSERAVHQFANDSHKSKTTVCVCVCLPCFKKVPGSSLEECQMNLQDKIESRMEHKQGAQPKGDPADVNRGAAVYHISHNNKLNIRLCLYRNRALRNR